MRIITIIKFIICVYLSSKSLVEPKASVLGGLRGEFVGKFGGVCLNDHRLPSWSGSGSGSGSRRGGGELWPTGCLVGGNEVHFTLTKPGLEKGWKRCEISCNGR